MKIALAVISLVINLFFMQAAFASKGGGIKHATKVLSQLDKTKKSVKKQPKKGTRGARKITDKVLKRDLESRGVYVDSKEELLYYRPLIGDVKATEKLIKSGADLNFLIKDFQSEVGTMIYWLTHQKKHYDIMTMLLDAGANPNIADSYGMTPLMWAVVNEDQLAFNLLVNHAKTAVDFKAQDYLGNTALHLSTRDSRTKFSRFLIEEGADLNIENNLGETPIRFLLKNGLSNEDSAELLIDLKASGKLNLEARNQGGVSYMDWAASNGEIDALELLVAMGAKVNVKDSMGNTPLMWASSRGYLREAMYLIQSGARPDMVNNDGMTALKLAKKYHRYDVADALETIDEAVKAALEKAQSEKGLIH